MAIPPIALGVVWTPQNWIDQFALFIQASGGQGVGNTFLNPIISIDYLAGAHVSLKNLPTSNAGLTTGDLYNNGQFLCIA